MSVTAERQRELNETAINNFREYLQIPSVHPDVNYYDCIEFLEKQAKGLDLTIKIYQIAPRKPGAVITWKGKKPHLQSILLHSHMDVVPVFEEKWTYKPFSAHVDKEGRIFGRGSQDMKSVGIQYLEAIRFLREIGKELNRTVHISFMPDEEIGGAEGMRKFAVSDDFKRLNVGFALDEGMASPNDEFLLFNGERCIWYIHIHCSGKPGHGSLLLENTAGEKVAYLLNKIYQFRDNEKKNLKENPNLTIGDVTTLNVTRLNGGVQSNVIPPEITIVVDCRIPVSADIQKWEEMLHNWCREAGPGVYITYQQKQPQIPATKLDNTNPFWLAFKQTSDKLGMVLKPQIFPGGTDSRYIRSQRIPAIGFSPINNTPVLLHDNDEFLSTDVFLKGIEIYSKIIESVANVEDSGVIY